MLLPVVSIKASLLALIFLLLFVLNHVWVRPLFEKLQSSNGKTRALRVASDLLCPDEPPPTIKEVANGPYYDATLCIYDEWDTVITKHWFNTLPPGVNSVYPRLAPEIFFHGRDSVPFDDLAKDGYLHDTGDFQSLWTVGVTDKYSDIQLTKGPFVFNYLVVFKLKNTSGYRNRVTVQLMAQTVPNRLKKEKRIIARIWNPGEHPDAYIFTKEAQKQENNPLEIIRVYRYHLHIPTEFWSREHDFPLSKADRFLS